MAKPPEHPSLDVLGEDNRYLAGRLVVLGVTGSVAIYRSLDLARWLLRRSARVKTVMTREAARLVSPVMFEWAVGDEVYLEFGGETGHITLSRRADSMVVAPATLSTMAKIAQGILDNPVALAAASVQGYGKPLIVVPAMHENLLRSPQYRRVEELLREAGAVVVPPRVEGGVAKYPEVHHVGRVVAALSRRGWRDLEGRRILVTAGPTREWLDPVRFLSNPSSGSMGVEIALEAWARGAQVDLVAGAVRVSIPHFINTVRVETTEEMARAVEALTSEREYDAVIGAAAPADFRPSETRAAKIPSGSSLTLTLEPTPKVLASVRRRPRVLVAFAAETVEDLDELKEKAFEKLEKYGADMVVGNIVGGEGRGFAAKTSTVAVVTRGSTVFEGDVHKEELAAIILDQVAAMLKAGEGAGRGEV